MNRTLVNTLVSVAIWASTASVAAQDVVEIDDPEVQKELLEALEKGEIDGATVKKLEAGDLPALQKLLKRELAQLDPGSESQSGGSGATDAEKAKAVELLKKLGEAYESEELLDKAKEAYARGLELDAELPEGMSIGPELQARLEKLLGEVTKAQPQQIKVVEGEGGGAKVIVIE